MKSYSIVDDGKEITEIHWAITLVIVHHHAALVIEAIQGDSFLVKLCDFMPTQPIPISPKEYLEYVKTNNSIMPGSVRVDDLSNCTHDYLFSELKKRYKDPSSMSLKTWVRPKEEIQTILDEIIAEKKNPPLYQASGDVMIGAKAHNCITWAEKKLRKIQIINEPSIPEKHDPTQRSYGYGYGGN